jgi:hypothetical protein
MRNVRIESLLSESITGAAELTNADTNALLEGSDGSIEAELLMFSLPLNLKRTCHDSLALSSTSSNFVLF